jgi:hypothetical protein
MRVLDYVVSGVSLEDLEETVVEEIRRYGSRLVSLEVERREDGMFDIEVEYEEPAVVVDERFRQLIRGLCNAN